MPTVELSVGRFYYEKEGDACGEPVLLIAGQGAQLISWHIGFRALLVLAGFQVILFDNRDVGLSVTMPDGASYDIADMAADTAELIDALGYSAVHVVGQSMGGMIGQELVIRYPNKVKSFTCIYSAPSSDALTQDRDVWAVRDQPPATDRESRIRRYIEVEALSGLVEYTDEWVRGHAEAVIDRSYCPEGADRQMAAVRRRPDATAALSTVTVPAAALHGLDDRLLSPTGSVRIAAAIAGCELHTFAGMGHQMLPSLFPDYVRVVERTAARAR